MHSMTHHHRQPSETSDHRTRGIVNISAWSYDLIVRWFVMHGKEQAFRRMVVDLALLQRGEAVLDVGCGTGTLALAAKERVEETGHVCGIDPSVQLLAGARRKAERAGRPIDFKIGGIEQLAYPDNTFDVVLSTFTMHHVPDDIKRQGLLEVARVLKPGGRLLLVDFRREEESQDALPQSTTTEIGLQYLPVLVKDAGFSELECGEIPFRIRSFDAGHQHYGFVRAKKPGLSEARANG